MTWRDRLFFEYSNVRGVRTGRYKLVLRTKEWPSELYDMEKDPGERANRFGDPALEAVRKALTAEMEGFFRDQGLRRWSNGARQPGRI